MWLEYTQNMYWPFTFLLQEYQAGWCERRNGAKMFFVHIRIALQCILSILTAIFLGEPGLAGFIGAKDDGSGGDNWSYKACKAPVKPTPNTTLQCTVYAHWIVCATST